MSPHAYIVPVHARDDWSPADLPGHPAWVHRHLRRAVMGGPTLTVVVVADGLPRTVVVDSLPVDPHSGDDPRHAQSHSSDGPRHARALRQRQRELRHTLRRAQTIAADDSVGPTRIPGDGQITAEVLIRGDLVARRAALARIAGLSGCPITAIAQLDPDHVLWDVMRPDTGPIRLDDTP